MHPRCPQEPAGRIHTEGSSCRLVPVIRADSSCRLSLPFPLEALLGWLFDALNETMNDAKKMRFFAEYRETFSGKDVSGRPAIPQIDQR